MIAQHPNYGRVDQGVHPWGGVERLQRPKQRRAQEGLADSVVDANQKDPMWRSERLARLSSSVRPPQKCAGDDGESVLGDPLDQLDRLHLSGEL